MNREQILEILILSKPALQAQFGVKRMALFGSTVRDEAPVDLVTEKALRPELRPYIEQEKVDV